MNGADSLCDTLLANDVDVCFANPGTSEMHFVAALDRKPRMRCVLGLFEGVVTGAADGYGRMAEKPAATLLHLGPGLGNGLANLHNARRAHTPMVNIVGEHASYHIQYDAPLTTDIESLARPMSNWVRRIQSSDDVSGAAAAAVAAARTEPGGIATLILPADAAWGQTAAPVSQAHPPAPGRIEEAALLQAREALRNGRKTLILLSGKALRAGPLETAARIAARTGARLMAQQSNGRMERGAGRVPIERVPYPVDAAVKALEGTEQLILIGARTPVAFFAYPGKPSVLIPEGCDVITLASPADDLPQALEQLADAVGATRDIAVPLAERGQPDLPAGALTASAVIQAIGALSPENAVICDESVSSGRDSFKWTWNAAPHDFLQITGGAIGIGIPLATGAAVACPDRKVILMQADGSAMYTVQGLWTQAREQLDVVTVIFANRRYAILHNELKMVGAGEPGRNASRMLNLDEPAIDWVHMAQAAGVEAARASDCAAFVDLLRAALARKGPFLIEAVI
ncbi:acetolactate synthase large subunit [Candidimonas nitroreducens]|uniref:Acetolactate synthase large subunit n=1 Tax=Candidimonas nitroreducens TaxID=683354 RepID=A0A225N1A9_9BURK|nr:acetolactate synthase large subunit [Candidimonas nitroreducens]OWT65641.1 acetolactate synthase large subunit [Candidimonas nitroreducens]